MKIKLLLILLVVALIGCNDKENTSVPDSQVVSLEKEGYLKAGEFLSVPKVLEKDALQKLKEFLKRKNMEERVFNASTSRDILFRLFVNDKGTVDKVVIINGIEKEVDFLLAGELKNWKFEPIQVDGKNVKFEYDWTLKSDAIVYLAVEEMPVPLGGIGEIQKNIVYPKEAKENGIQGRVFVQAVIDEEGNVESTNILKGIGYGCDDAAENAVKKVKFTSAKLKGKNVKVQIAIPIMFKLQ